MYLTDSDTIKICWYWPDTDTDTRIGAALMITEQYLFRAVKIARLQENPQKH